MDASRRCYRTRRASCRDSLISNWRAALRKEDVGLRPIGLWAPLRRVVSKAFVELAKEDARALLEPGGCEAVALIIVRACFGFVFTGRRRVIAQMGLEDAFNLFSQQVLVSSVT